jgi:hypothetical protein
MPLRRLTPAHMSCFAIGFPLLGTTEYPQAHFPVAKVPLLQQDKLTTAFLTSQQAIPYRTRGGTCCPRVSTPKIQSLADSSMTINIT